MKIGTVIKNHRKNLGLTQEEMANRLGVTAPAVNKWENNNTLPDITLLAPIARLLGITVDELLSFKEELTTKETNWLTWKFSKDLREKDFDSVFLSAKDKIEEYPSCEELILGIASVFLGWISAKGIPKNENYFKTIVGWNKQCLNSKNEEVRQVAAFNFFNFYYQTENYEEALRYIEYFPDEKMPINRNFLEANVYRKIERKDEAYRIYEELIMSRYWSLDAILRNLCMLYLEDGNREMANKLSNIFSTIGEAFEMTTKEEFSSLDLEIAIWEKDIAKTEQIMRELLDNIGSCSLTFMKSSLYKHMHFNDVKDEDRVSLGMDPESRRKTVISGFKDEKFDYMRGNEWWENLISCTE